MTCPKSKITHVRYPFVVLTVQYAYVHCANGTASCRLCRENCAALIVPQAPAGCSRRCFGGNACLGVSVHIRPQRSLGPLLNRLIFPLPTVQIVSEKHTKNQSPLYRFYEQIILLFQAMRGKLANLTVRSGPSSGRARCCTFRSSRLGVTDARVGLASRDLGICTIESEAGQGEIILLHIWQNICMVDEYQVLDIVWPSLIKGKIPRSPKILSIWRLPNSIVLVPYLCMAFSAKTELFCALLLLPPIASSFSRRDGKMKLPIPSHLISSYRIYVQRNMHMRNQRHDPHQPRSS